MYVFIYFFHTAIEIQYTNFIRLYKIVLNQYLYLQ